MNNLIDNLIEDGWLKTPRIIEAFRKIKRNDFMPARIGYAEGVAGGPEDIKHLSELDQPIPIGYGQTISQPLVVAFMLEHLQPKPGDKILDIGSGSGWTTALLAHIVGDKGRVISIEVVPELSKFGKENITKYNFIEKGVVEIVCADGSKGYKKQAPYDKILVSAAVQQEKIPEPWREQLKNGGRMVTPVLSSIWLLVKKSEKEFEETEFPGFAFVPLIEK
ncbi:protein-L-isoaspartate O-methyltransferase [Candidatus Parcubacteria bacterium]|nr:protein-L-isoaspartate O-methyltransferase [Candidatus Parcubacteria bacterium]